MNAVAMAVSQNEQLRNTVSTGTLVTNIPYECPIPNCDFLGICSSEDGIYWRKVFQDVNGNALYLEIENKKLDNLLNKKKKMKRKKSSQRKDHEGNSFKNLQFMCAYWGISTATYWSRKKKGMTLKEILTTPLERTGVEYDHLGRKFNNVDAMCTKWNISVFTYRSCLQRGMTKEEILVQRGTYTE